MGRWAQRRLGSSSGSGSGSGLAHMVEATLTDASHADVSYSSEVSAPAMESGDFISLPSGANADSVDQVDANTVTISWDAPAAGDTHIDYSGSTPGLLTPDTVNYS